MIDYDKIIDGVRQYCGVGCYGEAVKAGRLVRQTDVCKYPICSLCESRIREGLVHYRPSNGTEFDYFESACNRCKHHIDNYEDPKPGKLRPPFVACTWGVKDRLLVQQVESAGHISTWFDPADLDPSTCPATCKRYTPKDYPHDDRDAPKPDLPGQMTLGEIDVPVESVPALTAARGAKI